MLLLDVAVGGGVVVVVIVAAMAAASVPAFMFWNANRSPLHVTTNKCLSDHRTDSGNDRE